MLSYGRADDPAFADGKASTDAEQKHTENTRAGNKIGAVVFAAIVGIVVIFGILAGSGRASAAESRPKAILFLVDGLKATAFEEAAVQGTRAPNLKKLIGSGSHAACFGPSDTRCCRTQSGARLGAPYKWDSAPGLASILTGVDASKHQVYNDSFDAMVRFAGSMQPSVMKIATDNGLRTAAIGSDTLLTTVGTDAACNAYGVLDFECGVSALSRCMRSSSCNVADRLPLPTSRGVPSPQVLDEIASDALRAVEEGADLILVHLTRVNKAATTPPGEFDSSSLPYAAQLYLVDSLIGQVMSVIEKRSRELHENWLIMGTSDHGGHASQYGDVANQDDLVPLFAHVHTPSGHMALREPRSPVRHMDATPTLLQWFGLLGSADAARLDGRVQFICGPGGAAANCTTEA